jgi:hypothetical protein
VSDVGVGHTDGGGESGDSLDGNDEFGEGARLRCVRWWEKDLGSGRAGSADSAVAGHAGGVRGGQLAATYTPGGVQFAGSGFQFSVGRGSISRAGSTEAVSADLVRGSGGGTHGQGAVTDSFRPMASGIEQTFNVTSRTQGSDSLVIDVPVVCLSATTDKAAIDLTDSAGRVRATYSGLRVTDASGKAVPGHSPIVSNS